MGEFLAALRLRFTTAVFCLFVDEGRFLNRSRPLLRNIRREGVAIALGMAE